MSTIVFAGAAQFAAVGYVAGGLPWPGDHPADGAAQRPPPALLGGPAAVDAGRPVRAARRHGPPPDRRGLRPVHRRTSGGSAGRTNGATGSPRIGSTFIPWNLATLAGVVLGGQIPDPAAFGIDVIFPAAMIGMAVGLITGRRELVAALAGALVGVGAALVTTEAIGIVVGGLVGPVGRAARPGRRGAARRRRSARPRRRSATRCPASHLGRADAGRSRGPRPTMSTDLVLLAVLMFAVTYPSRALGLLTPVIERLPKLALDYLQLVGPAVLAAIAAVNVMVLTNDEGASLVPRRHRVGRGPRLPRHRGVAAEPAARAGGRGRDRRHRPRDGYRGDALTSRPRQPRRPLDARAGRAGSRSRASTRPRATGPSRPTYGRGRRAAPPRPCLPPRPARRTVAGGPVGRVGVDPIEQLQVDRPERRPDRGALVVGHEERAGRGPRRPRSRAGDVAQRERVARARRRRPRPGPDAGRGRRARRRARTGRSCRPRLTTSPSGRSDEAVAPPERRDEPIHGAVRDRAMGTSRSRGAMRVQGDDHRVGVGVAARSRPCRGGSRSGGRPARGRSPDRATVARVAPGLRLEPARMARRRGRRAPHARSAWSRSGSESTPNV